VAGTGGWTVASPTDDLLVPVRSLAALRVLTPDAAALGAHATVARLRGLALVSRETLEPTPTAVTILTGTLSLP
jgi:hypothetical protein